MGGLCDFTGELQRLLVQRATARDIETVRTGLQLQTEISRFFVEGPDAHVSGGTPSGNDVQLLMAENNSAEAGGDETNNVDGGDVISASWGLKIRKKMREVHNARHKA